MRAAHQLDGDCVVLRRAFKQRDFATHKTFGKIKIKIAMKRTLKTIGHLDCPCNSRCGLLPPETSVADFAADDLAAGSLHVK